MDDEELEYFVLKDAGQASGAKRAGYSKAAIEEMAARLIDDGLVIHVPHIVVPKEGRTPYYDKGGPGLSTKGSKRLLNLIANRKEQGLAL